VRRRDQLTAQAIEKGAISLVRVHLGILLIGALEMSHTSNRSPFFTGLPMVGLAHLECTDQ